MNFIYLLCCKSEAADLIKSLIKFLKINGIVVKSLRSDCGKEFDNNYLNKFLTKKGIIYERSIPYNKNQNGFIERQIRSVKQIAKIFQYSNPNLDPNLIYGEALLHAVFIKNLLPHKKLNFLTPNLIFNNSMSPRNLYTFGLEVFAVNLNRLKNDLPTKRCYFVGIDRRSKGYRLFDVITSKVFISNDIKPVKQNLKFYLNFNNYDSMIKEILAKDNEIINNEKYEIYNVNNIDNNFRDATDNTTNVVKSNEIVFLKEIYDQTDLIIKDSKDYIIQNIFLTKFNTENKFYDLLIKENLDLKNLKINRHPNSSIFR